MNKANISIRDQSFDFEHGIGGHDHGQLLGWRHHAAYSMNRKLLDNAIDRSGQDLEFCSLLCLCQIAAESGGLALRLSELAEQFAMKFRHRLSTSFDDGRYRGLRFNKTTSLNGSVILRFPSIAAAIPDR